MFEIDDPVRRARVAGRARRRRGPLLPRDRRRARCAGLPEGDIERTREDGKTSSVHFLHFRMTGDEIQAFRDAGVPVRLGCDHPRYDHTAALSDPTRAELAGDLG